MSADSLAEIVWGDDQPEGVREALHVLVWRLRRLLEPDRERRDSPTLLLSSPPGYVLLTRTHQLDSSLFTQLVTQAQAADEPLFALARLEEALTLWRGPPLGDLGCESWALPMAAKLNETRASAQELRLDTLSSLGRDDSVVADTVGLIDEHPTREGLWARRALALYRVGDQATALGSLSSARRFFHEEFGLEPGSQLRDLEQRILRDDATLKVSGRRVSAGMESLPSARRGHAVNQAVIELDDKGRAPLARLATNDRYIARRNSDESIVLIPAARDQGAMNGRRRRSSDAARAQPEAITADPRTGRSGGAQ